MKKSLPYEIVAAILAMLGAILLVSVYYPILNPIQYRIDSHQEAASLIRYILGTPVSLAILWAAWKFNRQAQGLKREEKDGKNNHGPSASLQIGNVYSFEDGDGRFGIAKLLAFEDGICHVQIYKQKFESRPKSIDVNSLSLGKPGDPDGFGIGHFPMRELSFFKWNPELIANSKVTPEELDGYEIWKTEGGGVF